MRTKPAVLLSAMALACAGPAWALDFPAASCKGWNGTVTAIDGVDTARASMSGTVTRPDIQEYCQRDPGGETRQHGGRLTVAQCVDNHAREVGRTELASEANCRAGTLSFRNGGGAPTRSKFPLQPDADTSCASGMPPLVAQFKMLCPAAAEKMRLE